MADCSECGKDSMTFTCKYCGEKFCAEHRLPENHDCEKLEQTIQKEKEESLEWFKEKKVRNDLTAKKPEKPSLTADILNVFKNNATISIIIFTVFIFFIQTTLNSTNSLPFYNLFALNSQISAFISKPWTLVTLMFLHGGPFHLFANMITLYFFGRPLENSIGSKNFLKFYFTAGIIASIGFILFRNIMALLYGPEVFGLALGASGAVVAVFAAVAILYPEAEILLYFVIPMKIRTGLYLFAGFETFILVGIQILNLQIPFLAGYASSFASSAHLAGLIFGVIFGLKIREKRITQKPVFDVLNY